MIGKAAAVDSSRYPFWVRNEGYEETLVHDHAEHFALLEERGLPATPPPLPIPAIETPPSSRLEYPKAVAGVIVEDAEEERIARAGDPDDIEGAESRHPGISRSAGGRCGENGFRGDARDYRIPEVG